MRTRGCLLVAVLALLPLPAAAGQPSRGEATGRGRRLRVVVTVGGRGTDWQNWANRQAARFADALGRREHITVTSLADMVTQLQALVATPDPRGRSGNCIETLSLWAHGYAGGLSLGRDALTLEILKGREHLAAEWDPALAPPRWRIRHVQAGEAVRRRDLLASLRPYLLADGEARARINLEACAVGLGRRGRSFILNLADLLGAEVFCVTGEHLGVRRFGASLLVRPGDSGRPWPAGVLVEDPHADDPRAYYGPESLGLRQQILDYELRRQDQRAGIVLRVGAWRSEAALPGFFGSGYLISAAGVREETAVHYLPIIPGEAVYAVEIRHPAAAALASAVPVDIVHADGTTRVIVNETQGGGGWKRLGEFRFIAGQWTSGAVIVRATDSAAQVVADAVRFITPNEASEVYAANREAIEAAVAHASASGADAEAERERILGTWRGLDPTDAAYGKLERERVREDRTSAVSLAWRSGWLGRFTRRCRAKRAAEGVP